VKNASVSICILILSSFLITTPKGHILLDSGFAETVPLIAVTNLARTLGELKQRGIWVFGADERGESLFDADVTGPIAWVLGAEGPGLRRLTRDTCDRLVRIPLFGGVESVNVSVAAGICLYATRAARNRPIAAGNGVG